MVRTGDRHGLTRGVIAAAAFAFGILANGCGSASQSVTAPSSSKCALAATADPASFPPGGGNGHISVNTNRECQWSVTATSGWIQLNGSKAGQGDARIPFAVAANADPAIRRGTVGIGDQQITISQEAAPCRFVVEPPGGNVPSTGGRGSFRVTATSPLCAWTARSEVAWLVIREGTNGTGDGEVVYEAVATTGPPRSGLLTIAGQAVAVTQGDGCSTSISPGAQTIAAAGGSGSVSVMAGEGCAWTALSTAPWVAITGGAAGSGPGQVTFSVGSSDGPARTATLQIAGHPFTVTQEAGCRYDISPSSASIGAGGGAGTAQVQTAAGCAWSASSAASWIVINSGASGGGPGEVRFTVSDNSGPERTGGLTIAGKTFTVTQASGCSIGITPTSQVFHWDGASGTIAVSAGAGCVWSAASSHPWAPITSGSSGSGAGTVAFDVHSNPGPPREATINVSGQIFTIQQNGGCTYSLSAESFSIDAAGGPGTVTVTTGDSCEWDTESAASWIAITAGQRVTGTGSVTFEVAGNDGPERVGTLVVADKPVTVTQAAGCRVTLGATGQAFGPEGGPGSVAVITGAGCEWSAASEVGWIQITGAASGSGEGTVNFRVERNTGEARTGRIVVSGQAFTVTQTGP
jgi:hypothetical protein